MDWEDPLEKGLPSPLQKARVSTAVFLPGEFHGQRSLEGCSPWGCKEPETTVTNTFTFIVDLHCCVSFGCAACISVYAHVGFPGDSVVKNAW